MKRKFLLVLTFTLLIASTALSDPLEFQPYGLYNFMEDLFKPTVPYSSLRDVLFFAIVPFLIAFTICFGILTELNIFKKKQIKLVISILFALSLMYYGVLSHIVTVVVSFGTFGIVIIFVVIFILGTIFFGRARTGYWKSKADAYGAKTKELQSLKKELKEVHEDLKVVREDLSEPYISPNQLKKLKDRESSLEGRATALRKEIADKITESGVLRDEAAFSG